MCKAVMYYGSKALENFSKRFFRFSYLLIMRLIEGFRPDEAIFSTSISQRNRNHCKRKKKALYNSHMTLTKSNDKCLTK